MMEYKRIQTMNVLKSRRKAFLLLAMLLTGGMASAQVTIKGNVYGGGELGDVSENTNVKINGGTIGVLEYSHTGSDPTVLPFDTVKLVKGGSVFGGSKGSLTDATKGLVKGNTNVEIRGGHMFNNVYGGGELGSVGTFDTINGNVAGVVENTGKTTVTVTGGQVGPAPKVDLEHGYNIPIALSGTNGYVFGGGKGNPDANHNSFANVGNAKVVMIIR